ncbi:toxin-antitoxin system YwqK family antitoxin, partial [Flavobacterium sp.]|uniref:toxin-antitoxin system YwqK family antitoxin n=1 Tax=Flavobacterium sp. TaxID=239 RepID=UPI003C331E7F
MKVINLSIVLFATSIFGLQAQSNINKLDGNGKKDGLWKGVYEESKRPKYEGTFTHGKEVGTFKFFDDTKLGSVIATREFSLTDGSAYTIFYDQQKNKVSEGKVTNKIFEGEWKYYHHSSNIPMTIEHYKNGKLDGLRSVFYTNGKIAEETNYKNDLKDGYYKKYSDNGVVLEETLYKASEYNGIAIFRKGDGTIASQGKFMNGKKVGVWQFFEKGKLVKEINMNDLKTANT